MARTDIHTYVHLRSVYADEAPRIEQKYTSVYICTYMHTWLQCTKMLNDNLWAMFMMDYREYGTQLRVNIYNTIPMHTYVCIFVFSVSSTKSQKQKKNHNSHRNFNHILHNSNNNYLKKANQKWRKNSKEESR